MNCPQCSRDIQTALKTCDSCGYTFHDEMYDRLSFYFDLKSERDNLDSIRDRAISDIKKLNSKVFKYEARLSADIEKISGELRKDISETEDLLQPEYEKADHSLEDVHLPPFQEVTANEKFDKPGYVEAKEPQLHHLSSSSRQSKKEETSQFEINIGQKWLLIIGIVTMVFGIGYFLKYSFERGWIGPAGRVALAYIWGAVFLFAGNKFRKKNYAAFGLSLVGGGIATLYFATFAAFQLYHLFAQTPSFLLMVLITVLASVLAIIYDTKWLAILGMIGGFLTPVMLSTGQDNYIFLFSYMTVLNLGLLGVAFYKKWDILNILGFISTYILYTSWFMNHYETSRFVNNYEYSKFWPAIIFLNIYYFIYSIIPFAYQFFRAKKESIRGFAIITPNSFIAFGFSYHMITRQFSLEWVSVISIMYSIVFLLMASYLYKTGEYEQDAFTVLIAKAALFLIITIPIIFSKHWITIFWAAQAAVLLWTGIRLERKKLVFGSYVLLAVTISKFLGYDYTAIFHFRFDTFHISGPYSYMLAERLMTTVFLILVMLAFSRIARQGSLTNLSGVLGAASNIKDSSVIFGICGILLFISLNVETSSFFYEYLPNAQFAAISVLWTLYSVLLMIKGFMGNIPFIRMASLGLFLVTLVKVFLFDMSKIHTPYRILSFIILGIVMIGASYLYHRYKDRIITALAADNQQKE
ncbi:MAG: DUF2339 domain-containing protein [Nitrospirota bacterium]